MLSIKRDAQHLGDGPELSDRQRAHGLIGLDKRKDVLPVQAQVRVGDEFLRQAVDARQTPVGLVGERRQLLVETPGKIQLNVAYVALNDVLIVEEPLGGWRHALSQPARFGKIQSKPDGSIGGTVRAA